MADPLKSFIRQEKAKQVIFVGLLLLLSLFAAVSIYWPSKYFVDGSIVEAKVLRIGTYAVAEGRGGDLPILTVQLPNGSVRQVKASWATGGECAPGSRVSLLQRGTALQVALNGCRPANAVIKPSRATAAQ